MSWYRPESIRLRLIFLAIFLGGATTICWVSAGILFRDRQPLLAACGVSYSLGLRHALDADHISAIDNVTRKFINENRVSTGVGLFFSLGHSILVVAGCLILYFTERAWEDSNPTSIEVLNIVSSLVASVFLLGIGIFNSFQLHVTRKQLQKIKRNMVYDYGDETGFNGASGLISCCASGLFKMVKNSFWMCPVGFIFGLGFDTTASVTAVMATAASKTSDSSNSMTKVGLGEALLLPLLFTCGMCTIDTADSIMMLGSYRWSDKNIVRKLFFNFVILLISVSAAILIGVIIGLRLIIDLTHCAGSNCFCDAVDFIDGQFQYIGVFLTLLFIAIWVGGYFYYTNSHWAKIEEHIYYVNAPATSQADCAISQPAPMLINCETKSHQSPRSTYDTYVSIEA